MIPVYQPGDKVTVSNHGYISPKRNGKGTVHTDDGTFIEVTTKIKKRHRMAAGFSEITLNYRRDQVTSRD